MRNIETTTQNLLFLLAAAPLGMGCIIVTDDTDDTQGDTSTPATTGGTPETGETGSNPVTGGATGEETSAGPTTGEATTGPDDTGMVDSSGGGLDPSICNTYGEHAYECKIPYSAYAAEGCYYNLDYQTNTSAECELAFLEYMACLSELSCEELMTAKPCFDQLDALLALGCPAVE